MGNGGLGKCERNDGRCGTSRVKRSKKVWLPSDIDSRGKSRVLPLFPPSTRHVSASVTGRLIIRRTERIVCKIRSLRVDEDTRADHRHLDTRQWV